MPNQRELLTILTRRVDDLLTACNAEMVRRREAERRAEEAEQNFTEFVRSKLKWSEETFGAGPRPQPTIAHIRKELIELEANPSDPMEWIDVALLAIDGYCRLTGTPECLLPDMKAKLAILRARKWVLQADGSFEHDRGFDITL